MELSVAIQAKVEVTPSNWNFGFQPTAVFRQFPGTIPRFSPRETRENVRDVLGYFCFREGT